MALTYGMTYTFVDDSGETATATISLPTSFTLAQFTEFGRAMAGFIDNIVSGLVSRCELTVGVSLATLTGNTAAAGGDVQEVNRYQFVTAAGRQVNINIPGTDETDVNPNSDELDTTDTEQAAFITAMLSGVAVTGGTIIPCDVDSEDLTALVFARESARATGKRR